MQTRHGKHVGKAENWRWYPQVRRPVVMLARKVAAAMSTRLEARGNDNMGAGKTQVMLEWWGQGVSWRLEVVRGNGGKVEWWQGHR